MRAGTFILLIISGGMSACASPGGPYPSLAHRAGEDIDPRVPVVRPMNERPVTPALASRLAELLADARSGDAAFEPAIEQAEQAAAAAGAPQSESWVAAQQALSVAATAREPTVTALGDIDALGANALQTQGGLAPNDLAAIKNAGTEVSAIDQRQAERIKAIQRRLGI